MKIIHVPFCFYPDPAGGTEVYVESLARHMQERNVAVTIVAPGERSSFYEYKGLTVRRFAVSDEVDNIRDLYGSGDLGSAQEFTNILDEEQPDIVHLHALSRGASIRLVREAKRRGIKTVFTYHTPTVSCQRGTMMRWGSEICDGKLDIRACAGCTLQARGLSRMNSLIFGRVPTFIGRLAGAAGLSGGGWTALRMTELIHLRHSAFRALMKEVDQVVALCQWVRDLLSRSEVPTEKITISRHGLPQRTETIDADPIPVTSIPLRIAFLGRMHRTKGADVLIRALRSLPKAIIELHLYGIVQADNTGTKYLQQLKKLAEDDPRIHFLPAIPSNCVVSLLRGYHLLAVPSRLLETGPLVVLESFAAGTPVIGSNLGGIAEMVEDEVNGFLVEVDSVEGWSRAIRRCYDDRTLLNKLRRGIRPPRGMEAVANEMLLLYEKTLSEASVHEIPSYFLKKVEAHS